uniref:Gag-pol protein n=1 Tax=Solanum tuberosum TaxID=4113 RepID=M1DWL7_SOLTU
MVADMRSRMRLFVAGLSRLSSKEGKTTMLIGDMDIARLIIYVQQVEEDKLRDKEKFKNKRAKTSGMSPGSTRVMPTDRVASRRATSGAGGGGNHLYAITNRQEQEDSPDVVTGMIQVFNFNVYALLDPGASLSFVTPYVPVDFNVLLDKLSEPFSVSTPVGFLEKRTQEEKRGEKSSVLGFFLRNRSRFAKG